MPCFPSKIDFLIFINGINIFKVIQTQELGVSFYPNLFLIFKCDHIVLSILPL